MIWSCYTATGPEHLAAMNSWVTVLQSNARPSVSWSVTETGSWSLTAAHLQKKGWKIETEKIRVQNPYPYLKVAVWQKVVDKWISWKPQTTIVMENGAKFLISDVGHYYYYVWCMWWCVYVKSYLPRSKTRKGQDDYRFVLICETLNLFLTIFNMSGRWNISSARESWSAQQKK